MVNGTSGSSLPAVVMCVTLSRNAQSIGSPGATVTAASLARPHDRAVVLHDDGARVERERFEQRRNVAPAPPAEARRLP